VNRLFLSLVLLLLVVVLVLLLARTRDTSPATRSPLPVPSSPAPRSSLPVPPSHDPALDRLHQPDVTPEAELLLVHGLLERYRMFVKDHAAAPAGSNAELVRRLQGRNRANLAFIPATHPALNESGELIDRWGTPYVFHALSSTRTEIRSAGPDRRLWTDDDLLHTPPSTHPLPIERPR